VFRDKFIHSLWHLATIEGAVVCCSCGLNCRTSSTIDAIIDVASGLDLPGQGFVRRVPQTPVRVVGTFRNPSSVEQKPVSRAETQLRYEPIPSPEKPAPCRWNPSL